MCTQNVTDKWKAVCGCPITVDTVLYKLASVFCCSSWVYKPFHHVGEGKEPEYWMMLLPHFPIGQRQHLSGWALPNPSPPLSHSEDTTCNSAVNTVELLLTDRKRHQSMRKHRVGFYQILGHLRVPDKAAKNTPVQIRTFKVKKKALWNVIWEFMMNQAKCIYKWTVGLSDISTIIKMECSSITI